MTNEEAVNWIKYSEDIQWNEGSECAKEAIKLAIEALEKQIPKKPMEKDGWLACPNCEISMSGRMYVPWCDNCGQALDWSEEE